MFIFYIIKWKKNKFKEFFRKWKKIQVKCSIINKSKYYNSKASQRLYFVLYNFLMKHEKQQQQEKKWTEIIKPETTIISYSFDKKKTLRFKKSQLKNVHISFKIIKGNDKLIKIKAT